MKRWVWIDGRLSWGAVGIIVSLSVSVLTVDMLWRLVQIQFDTLLIYVALAGMAAAATVILLVRGAGRRCRRVIS